MYKSTEMLKYLNCSDPFSSYPQNSWEGGFATYSKARKGSGAKVTPQLGLPAHPPATQRLREAEGQGSKRPPWSSWGCHGQLSAQKSQKQRSPTNCPTSAHASRLGRHQLWPPLLALNLHSAPGRHLPNRSVPDTLKKKSKKQ